MVVIEDQRGKKPDNSPHKIKRNIMKPGHRKEAKENLAIKDEILRFEEEEEEKNLLKQEESNASNEE
ncbi:hypothetical protein HK099_004115 [Clydaea vesicula]|uniref:Uncharacterized protein n=1 Tax=Clydaea vesicula TaxID=447962 RepID=A0AAD5U0W7_9FUNG|nr:hypothetical protein HK099_004115 [Clydaea vesicula]KAJ3392992.1 hypothetical protein HDU92_008071 [Lobulomyces angularis]